MKNGLSKRDYETVKGILEKYPEITLVNLFGSRATGTFHAGSDIDLAIMNKGVTDEIIQRILSDFEESTLPYFVDIINYYTIEHKPFREHIDRVGQLFYQKKMVNK
jgi:predicted nucleotidyltransferase